MSRRHGSWLVCLLLTVASAHGADAVSDPHEAVSTVPPQRVVHFEMDGDELVASAEVDVGGGVQVLKLAGLPGDARVQAVARTRQRQMAASVYFSLTHKTDPQSDGSETTTVIQLRSGYVGISRTIRKPGETAWMNFSQNRYRRGGDNGGQVSLQVRSTRRNGDNGMNDFFTADNLAELFREHPAECIQHLAPVFRDFGQEEAIFGVEPERAWQVLGPQLEEDAAFEAKVKTLVQALGDGDFRKRESALNDLVQLGGPAARLLLDKPRYDLSPEQNTRLEAFLAGYQSLSPQRIAELRQDTDFLVRCFIYNADERIRAAAQVELLHKAPEAAKLDPRAGREDRAKAAGLLRDRLPGQ